MKRLLITVFAVLLACPAAMAQQKKPNILVIMGDDIGWFNPSCYNSGIMGYQHAEHRPHREGRRAVHRLVRPAELHRRPGRVHHRPVADPHRADQGRPAGRRHRPSEGRPERRGLPEEPRLRDRPVRQEPPRRQGRDVLPTVHGFDEFFGNLYHLNAEEEPENPDYPKNPEFKKKFGPRGVLQVQGDADGKQTIEDTGPLTRKRMETVDEEFLAAALDFIDRQHKANKPFFCYFNSTRMHVFTHLKKESEGKTGLGLYPDGMVEHDGMVGQLLKKLDDLGIADNTIVVYTTDNGAEVMTWPDGGSTPFKGEKATNWEGGVPRADVHPLARRHQARHDRQRHLRPRGPDPDVRRRRRRAGPRREGEEGLPGRRQELQGPPRRLQPDPVPQGRGEGVAAEGVPLLERRRRPDGHPRQPVEGRVQGAARQGQRESRQRLAERSSRTCAPRTSTTCAPTRSSAAPESFEYGEMDGGSGRSCIVPAQAIVAQWLSSFKEFPPRQKPASFNLDEVMRKMTEQPSGGK